MPPSVAWALSIIKVFSMSSHLPPVWGAILAKVIYLKKSIRLKRGLQMIYFRLVNGLSKNGLSSSQTYALWIGKPCFHASMQSNFSLFIQIKLNFGVTSWCFFFFLFFFRVFYVYSYLSKESPEFPELVCLNKHQYDFCFVLNFEFPKILVNMCDYA
jgi:hypothetical protein